MRWISLECGRWAVSCDGGGGGILIQEIMPYSYPTASKNAKRLAEWALAPFSYPKIPTNVQNGKERRKKNRGLVLSTSPWVRKTFFFLIHTQDLHREGVFLTFCFDFSRVSERAGKQIAWRGIHIDAFMIDQAGFCIVRYCECVCVVRRNTCTASP